MHQTSNVGQSSDTCVTSTVRTNGPSRFPMGSLKKLFASHKDYLVLLASMSAQGPTSAKAVLGLTRGGAAEDVLRIVRESRVKERSLAAEIEELLCNSQPAPFGRDDVEPLTRAVQAVPRSIRTFAERYHISRAHFPSTSFSVEAAMLETATETLHQLVLELHNGTRVGVIKTYNDKLQSIEGEMDQKVIDSIVELYGKTDNPISAIVRKDLYELMERTFDRCRTAGNLILRIAMKHS